MADRAKEHYRSSQTSVKDKTAPLRSLGDDLNAYMKDPESL
ncbi:hypothetical protein [Bartonella tribocorum]|nr:hypothetical protein [Bartonella tribocorum]